jgi:hypothetical protein
MALQLATRIPEPDASSQPSGTVRSIEHARRRRRRSIAASGRIGVLIVAGDALMRAGLRRLLDDDAGLTVLGEAANGSEAARQHSLTDAEVVVLDAGRHASEAIDLALAARQPSGPPRRGGPHRRERRCAAAPAHDAQADQRARANPQPH